MIEDCTDFSTKYQN